MYFSGTRYSGFFMLKKKEYLKKIMKRTNVMAFKEILK